MISVVKKRFLLIGGIFSALCLAVTAILLFLAASMASEHSSQLAAERWETKELPYTQVSCFVSEDAAFTSDSLYSVRKNIDTSLTSQSLSAEGSARLWYDSFSTESTLSVSAAGGTSVSARAFITGGDYFLLHEMNFMSGWHYTDDDVADDGVVIDSELAWKLFGGYSLDGMTINIRGMPCRVIGVVEGPSGKADREAYGDEPTLFISYKYAERMGISDGYTLYEAVIPDPVDGMGLKTIKDNFPLVEGEYVTVENSGRFGFVRSLGTLMNFDTLVQRTDRVYFPYFENSARGLEARCAFISLIISVLLALAALYVFIAAAILFASRGVYIEKLKNQAIHKKIKTNRR